MRIRVRHWEPEEDCIDRVFERDTSGEWHCVEPADTSIELRETVNLTAEGVVKIEVISGEVDPQQFVDLLPDDVIEDLGYARYVETLDPMIDNLDENICPVVLVNGTCWFPFATYGSGALWLPVTPDLDHPSRPSYRQLIAQASGIENGSMCGGTFSWDMGILDNDLVCIHTNPDDEQATIYCEPRNGRTNAELIDLFINSIEWGPVADAVSAARDAGGKWFGSADQFDPEGSSTCEVWASVSL